MNIAASRSEVRTVSRAATTRGRESMADHKSGTSEEWLAARLELLEAEKALTRRSDELAQLRQELPWVSNRQRVPLRDRRGHSVPRRSLQGTLAAPYLTDWARYRREGPGVSAFALEDGVVYHTYSAYERGLDVLWGMYQWFDRAPLGRNETGIWWRRHDEYKS